MTCSNSAIRMISELLRFAWIAIAERYFDVSHRPRDFRTRASLLQVLLQRHSQYDCDSRPHRWLESQSSYFKRARECSIEVASRIALSRFLLSYDYGDLCLKLMRLSHTLGSECKDLFLERGWVYKHSAHAECQNCLEAVESKSWSSSRESNGSIRLPARSKCLGSVNSRTAHQLGTKGQDYFEALISIPVGRLPIDLTENGHQRTLSLPSICLVLVRWTRPKAMILAVVIPAAVGCLCDDGEGGTQKLIE